MPDMSVNGHQSAAFRPNMQRAVSTELDASSTKEITKTLGINFSDDNDFTVEVPYTDNQGNKQSLFVTPDDQATLRSIAQATARADYPEPIEVMQSGQVVGRIDPKDVK